MEAQHSGSFGCFDNGGNQKASWYTAESLQEEAQQGFKVFYLSMKC